MKKLTIYKDNITERNTKFEKLLLLTQAEMKTYVKARLENYGNAIEGDGFIYHKGTFPVLLCAHMDTVHKKIPRVMVYANGTLSSPQGIGGDDRCGIYMIFKILKKYDCSVVFLEDEEIGCVGAKKFANSIICTKIKQENKLKYIIEFDRKGNNHAVTYDCDNKEFDEFITKEFFKKEYGTCSDISYIAPELGVAAVNLSCGYYKEHNIEEWVNIKEMERVIVEAIKVIERTKELEKPFEYIKSKRSRYGYGYYGYDSWDDYDYYNRYSGNCGYGGYGGYGGTYKSGSTSKKVKYTFKYKTKYGSEFTITIFAKTDAEAFYEFFKTHTTVCYADIISSKREEV